MGGWPYFCIRGEQRISLYYVRIRVGKVIDILHGQTGWYIKQLTITLIMILVNGLRTRSMPPNATNLDMDEWTEDQVYDTQCHKPWYGWMDWGPGLCHPMPQTLIWVNGLRTRSMPPSATNLDIREWTEDHVYDTQCYKPWYGWMDWGTSLSHPMPQTMDRGHGLCPPVPQTLIWVNGLRTRSMPPIATNLDMDEWTEDKVYAAQCHKPWYG